MTDKRDTRLKAELKRGHVVIERLWPEIDCGRYRAKAVVGDLVTISCDVLRDGPALLQAVVRYRGPSDKRWSEAPMTHSADDRYIGSFRPGEIGVWRYTIEAWTDRFGTWRRDLLARADAGQDVGVELEEGALLIEARLGAVGVRGRRLLTRAVEALRGKPGKSGADDPRVAVVRDESLVELMARHADRAGTETYKPVLELTVDRERARFGAWYEFFPRSTGTKKTHGTFKTAAAALNRIADMGFDVVYLPPIHPIGSTFRKGRNNSLEAGPDDIGVPWAIGNKEGGHSAVHPQLGTIADFDDFVAAATRLGLEVALDLAYQCSPDHPWVKEHPEWFQHRPDGSIRYAENPPKKYQDIYPLNFDTEDRTGLWLALKDVVDFWIDHGVKIFRVDNPHTKPLAFWEWMIDAVKDEHPDTIFLSEAFTRSKVMRALAKLGFTQSYTYFTWRNTKHELIEYLTELTQTEMVEYFRPNFFANTPDILSEYLQMGGPAAFKIRFVLAALLSPSYGIYSGYELFENVPVRRGSEEYLHSEKYELKPRDYDQEPNLNEYITRVNDIRHKHPALSEFRNLHWHNIDKDHMLAFSKGAPDGDTILVVVNLNPFLWEEATLHLDLEALGLEEGESFEVRDLISDEVFTWRGASNYVRLDPFDEPAHIFAVGG